MKLLRRFRYWLHSARRHDELAEELEFHRAMLAKDEAPRGTLGNSTLAREEARAVWIWPWLESLRQDAAYGLRAMRRQPAFTATALLALGSAIGINTSLFTIFNAFALQPWPVRDPGRVVSVYRLMREGAAGFGIAEYRYLVEHARSFTGLITMRRESVNAENHRAELTYASANYFSVAGVSAARGRGFLDEEDRAGAPQAVAVISHDMWQTRFGGDEAIVGRRIRLDDVAFTVVGVAPAGFTGTSPTRNDVWVPLSAKKLLSPNDPSVEPWLRSPEHCCSPVAGRLAPGITRAAAQAEIAVLLDQFRRQNHLDGGARILVTGTTWMDSPNKKWQGSAMLALLFLAVTLVLLLACANVGNLLLARAAARRQEIAVRLSLGGSRFRVIRQLLVESLLLALGAAALGLGVAFVVPNAVIHRLAGPVWSHITPDATVLAYTAGIAVLSAVAFGLAPALHATRGGIAVALKNDSPLARARLPLRSVLLSVQVAISVMLLANAGLLVRGLERAQAVDPGFDVQGVTVLSTDLPAAEYAGARTQLLARNLLAQIESDPSLPPCGLTLDVPLGNAIFATSFQLDAGTNAPPQRIQFHEVSGGYFSALGIRVLAGRNFAAEDAARDVVMFNQSAARRWWPGQNPVGKTILSNGKVRQITGVVADAYTGDLSAVEPAIYFPMGGDRGSYKFSAPFLLLRDRTPAAAERVAAMVKQLEPRAQVRAEPLSANFDRQMQPSIVGAMLAGFLGLLALAIASVGMAGVFAYVVGQRTREIGVRMALGAQASQIVGLVLGSSLRPLVCGLAAGIAGAAGASLLLAHLLPGVKPADPLAYVNVVLLLSAAVALASAVPARRATRVDPVRALRWE